MQKSSSKHYTRSKKRFVLRRIEVIAILFAALLAIAFLHMIYFVKYFSQNKTAELEMRVIRYVDNVVEKEKNAVKSGERTVTDKEYQLYKKYYNGFKEYKAQVLQDQ